MTVFQAVAIVFGAIAIANFIGSIAGDKTKAKDRRDWAVYFMCISLWGMASTARSDHRELEKRVEAIEKSSGIKQ